MTSRRRARAPRGATLTRVDGVAVGHAEDPAGTTGVTVVRFDRAAPTAVDVRGGASCTYDISSLDLDATFGRRWAIFFSGGSVLGLDAARGVRTCLLSEGRGHVAFRNPNLIVPISGACLFDLPPTQGPVPDYLPLGHRAAEVATRAPVLAGRVGAGAGARIGKYLGIGRAAHGGVGSAAVRVPGGHWVGALAVVNSVGAVRDPADGRWIAGPRNRSGRLIPPGPRPTGARAATPLQGTTLACVVTDAPAERRVLRRMAVAGQSAVARVVVPVHTATDGDVVFASTTREAKGTPREGYPGAHADALGYAAALSVERAVLEAARGGARASRVR